MSRSGTPRVSFKPGTTGGGRSGSSSNNTSMMKKRQPLSGTTTTTNQGGPNNNNNTKSAGGSGGPTKMMTVSIPHRAPNGSVTAPYEPSAILRPERKMSIAYQIFNKHGLAASDADLWDVEPQAGDYIDYNSDLPYHNSDRQVVTLPVDADGAKQQIPRPNRHWALAMQDAAPPPPPPPPTAGDSTSPSTSRMTTSSSSYAASTPYSESVRWAAAEGGGNPMASNNKLRVTFESPVGLTRQGRDTTTATTSAAASSNTTNTTNILLTDGSGTDWSVAAPIPPPPPPPRQGGSITVGGSLPARPLRSNYSQISNPTTPTLTRLGVGSPRPATLQSSSLSGSGAALSSLKSEAPLTGRLAGQLAPLLSSSSAPLRTATRTSSSATNPSFLNLKYNDRASNNSGGGLLLPLSSPTLSVSPTRRFNHSSTTATTTLSPRHQTYTNDNYSRPPVSTAATSTLWRTARQSTVGVGRGSRNTPKRRYNNNYVVHRGGGGVDNYEDLDIDEDNKSARGNSVAVYPEMPDHPSVHENAIKRETMQRLQRHNPWQFDPSTPIPLSLLMQRGLNHHDHFEEIDRMMHPRLLRDLGPCRKGTQMVKYPRTDGSPHERFFKIAMLKVGDKGGEAAYLIWYQHPKAHSPAGQVPLTHLVGVTESPLESSAFRPYLNPSKISSRSIDAGTYAAIMEGDAVMAGPIMEGTRRRMIPTANAFTLWFCDPRKNFKAFAIDIAAYDRDVKEHWCRVMRGLVRLNNSGQHHGTGAADGGGTGGGGGGVLSDPEKLQAVLDKVDKGPSSPGGAASTKAGGSAVADGGGGGRGGGKGQHGVDDAVSRTARTDALYKLARHRLEAKNFKQVHRDVDTTSGGPNQQSLNLQTTLLQAQQQQKKQPDVKGWKALKNRLSRPKGSKVSNSNNTNNNIIQAANGGGGGGAAAAAVTEPTAIRPGAPGGPYTYTGIGASGPMTHQQAEQAYLDNIAGRGNNINANNNNDPSSNPFGGIDNSLAPLTNNSMATGGFDTNNNNNNNSFQHVATADLFGENQPTTTLFGENQPPPPPPTNQNGGGGGGGGIGMAFVEAAEMSAVIQQSQVGGVNGNDGYGYGARAGATGENSDAAILEGRNSDIAHTAEHLNRSDATATTTNTNNNIGQSQSSALNHHTTQPYNNQYPNGVNNTSVTTPGTSMATDTTNAAQSAATANGGGGLGGVSNSLAISQAPTGYNGSFATNPNSQSGWNQLQNSAVMEHNEGIGAAFGRAAEQQQGAGTV